MLQTHKVFLKSEIDVINFKLYINYIHLTFIMLIDNLKKKKSLPFGVWRWILDKREVKKVLVLLIERKVVTIWEIASI